ncbi:MAG: DNRLRE domain-containing protein [Deltaproteobacteria bacterium]|nr:DNRLRE domain-containing protein [Deltaproteobacteria bacterium]
MGARITLLLAALLLGAASSAQEEEVVTLEPFMDNTIFEFPSGNSGGASRWLFSGVTSNNAGPASARRALLAFDVAGSIEAGSEIESVSLEMHVSRTQVGTMNFSLHPMLGDWGETDTGQGAMGGGGGAPAQPGDATWIQAFAGDMDSDWSAQGGDFVSVVSATTSVGSTGTRPVWSSDTHPALIDDVQSWLDEPAGNQGWIVVGPEGAGVTSKRFDSREATTVDDRPMLTISFVPEPSPSALAGAALATLAVLAVLAARDAAAGRTRRRQPEKYFA